MRLNTLGRWDSGGRISGLRRLAGRCKSSRTELKRGTVDDSPRNQHQKINEKPLFGGVQKTQRFEAKPLKLARFREVDFQPNYGLFREA